MQFRAPASSDSLVIVVYFEF